MADYPTAIPSQPVRNLQSMAGRGGTGIEHDDEHVLIFDEIIAICEAIGIPGDGGTLATRLRNIEFARSLTVTVPNLAITSAGQVVSWSTTATTWAGLRGQAPNLAIVQRTGGGSALVQSVPIAYNSDGTQYQITFPATGTWSLTLKVV